MRKVQFLTWAIFCYFLGVLNCGADCPFQECYCVGTTISCEEKGLTAIPPLINTNYSGLTSLTLDGNQITSIPSGSLPSDLISISLINNPTTIIDDAAFDGSANSLETLTLASFRFTRIPDAFRRLNTLQALTLYEANITDWNLDVMKKIGQSLVTLYLENIGLKTWPEWIQYCPHLTQLSVVGGTISFIPNGTLDLVSGSLKSLYLYSNRLSAVPQAISKLTALQVLNLRNNTITDLTWLPTKSTLMDLSFETNRISDATHLSNALSPFGDSLSNVYLQENHLTAIPNLTFLTKVVSLDFSDNRISDINSGAVPPDLFNLNLASNFLPAIPRMMSGLKSVTYLVLPSNAIRSIHDVEFSPNTVGVELAFNLITELTDTSFPQKSNIRYLHLNNNPLVKISTLSFKNLQFLIELNLRSTKLTRLPLALASLTSLNVFDITGSMELVCTCTEKSLGPWIASLFPSNVVGTCGRTSIYDFFVNLSPACPEQ